MMILQLVTILLLLLFVFLPNKKSKEVIFFAFLLTFTQSQVEVSRFLQNLYFFIAVILIFISYAIRKAFGDTLIVGSAKGNKKRYLTSVLVVVVVSLIIIVNWHTKIFQDTSVTSVQSGVLGVVNSEDVLKIATVSSFVISLFVAMLEDKNASA
jgi:magnesium-transporting ATPase (P-type)